MKDVSDMRYMPDGYDGITVHLVFNAHLDPVWLWPWQSGLDEAVATCRSACDRLNNHPDLVFTRGEAWVYDAVERIDPELFERIRQHIVAGRWEIAGGWWIQPDCNQPSGWGLAKQIEIGKSYFLDRFKQFPRIAYNVDSFGHAASLPRIMRDHGQDHYVMMRPQEHELTLPSRLFRWRGHVDDPEVVTFRIARNYEIAEITHEHIRASLEGLPDSVRHTMCFVGVGDHGGGPTERQIQWCRDQENAFDGCRLRFSSPARFFEAVRPHEKDLPLYTGELQYHAVGCYSVTRSIKIAVRNAEHKLDQARQLLALTPSASTQDVRMQLEQAWRHVCFNHFHDTLGGACIPSAYPALLDQVGAASAVADDILQFTFRKNITNLPDDRRQRIVLFNLSERIFDGYVTLAPWTEELWQPHWQVLDEQGNTMPHQIIKQEALARHVPRVVFQTMLQPGETKLFFLDRETYVDAPIISPTPITPAQNETEQLVSGTTRICLTPTPTIDLADCKIRLSLDMIEDPTGTWAHGVDRFADEAKSHIAWSALEPVHKGPLLASTVQRGQIDKSDVLADWRVYADMPLADLNLRIHWHTVHHVLKLVLTLPDTIDCRMDGILGGTLDRSNERRERPIRDFTLIQLRNGQRIGVVCPDVYAMDAGDNYIRLTLLRSAFMAHHHPSHPETPPHGMVADQGMHSFRFEFLSDNTLEASTLEDRAMMLHRIPLTSDYTKGMLSRSRY